MADEKGVVRGTLERMGEAALEFFRKDLEQKYEGILLDLVRKFPAIRALYEQFGRETLIRFLTLIIGQLPDVKGKGLQGKVLLLLREFVNLGPRELGRILSEGRDLGAGPGGPGVTPATPAQIGALIAQIAQLDDDDQEEFLVWLENLNPRDRAFFWGEVGKWRPEERMVFMSDYDVVQRNAVIRQFVPEQPPAPTPEEEAARRARVEARNARATKILNPLTEAIRGITTRLNSDLPRP